ncbi:hypothetical protein C8R45DRAFT_1094939 [Mycena sanguinolenta]|nr:hypothetical protein C8R45DRAFT_1094939 [Mycena sanguinolenta]
MSDRDASIPPVPASTTVADEVKPSPLSENERLINALQMCFQDLIAKQEEQSEKIHKAIEALKPPAPIQDKKTQFWNSYMKLADEYDNDFQQK